MTTKLYNKQNQLKVILPTAYYSGNKLDSIRKSDNKYTLNCSNGDVWLFSGHMYVFVLSKTDNKVTEVFVEFS